MERYVEVVCGEIKASPSRARALGVGFEPLVDSIYLGGGTPTILAPEQLSRIFTDLRHQFEVLPEAEITVECAPGSLSDQMLNTLVECGVNRVSLGVQSFVDREARAVGRLHDRKTTEEDVARLRAAGIGNISLDLIAGLPHQTAASWEESLDALLALEPPHASVYMLEVDEDSRLGQELIAGGARYHAHHVPNDDLIAELYLRACQRLQAAGIEQYEISNFARAGMESRHNLKYWQRQPYLGFGLDAHSMLLADREQPMEKDFAAVRFANVDELQDYLEGKSKEEAEFIDPEHAIEEEFFLGLRRNVGVDLVEIQAKHHAAIPALFLQNMEELVQLGLLQQSGSRLALTERGRLLSNEVFSRFIRSAVVA
jgi:oxygen-independent coproporphyrinogen-3 oxidase